MVSRIILMLEVGQGEAGEVEDAGEVDVYHVCDRRGDLDIL